LLTVRFPNGQAVQYNTANYVKSSTEYSDIYEKKDGVWVAQVPNTCIIEAVNACRVYHAPESELTASIANQIEVLGRKLLRAYRDEARKTSTNKRL